MGRIKRGGYIIEWWMGDHEPKHVHVFKDGKAIGKIVVPGMRVLNGRMNKRLRKILEELIQEGKI